MADKSKDIKKHQNAPTKHTERVKLLRRFLDEYT